MSVAACGDASPQHRGCRKMQDAGRLQPQRSPAGGSRTLVPWFVVAAALSWAGGASAASPPTTIETASLAADATSVSLRFADHRSRSFRVDDAGTTFGPPRLSKDRRLAGWTELRDDGGSYASPVGIAVYRAGRLHHVACDGGAPLAWRFSGRGSVVLKCAFPHGPGTPWLQRTDLATGRPAGRVDLAGDAAAAPATAPDWARVRFPD